MDTVVLASPLFNMYEAAERCSNVYIGRGKNIVFHCVHIQISRHTIVIRS
jgi:hypothetical protein